MADHKKQDHICYCCDATKSYIRNDGKEIWRFHDGYWLCRKCWWKYVWRPTLYQRTIRFLNRRVKLKFKIKTGICSLCKEKRKTGMHHWFYLIIMPWACTVELCNPCHGKEGWRAGQYDNRIKNK